MSQTTANLERNDMPEIHTKARCFKHRTYAFFNITNKNKFGH